METYFGASRCHLFRQYYIRVRVLLRVSTYNLWILCQEYYVLYVVPYINLTEANTHIWTDVYGDGLLTPVGVFGYSVLRWMFTNVRLCFWDHCNPDTVPNQQVSCCRFVMRIVDGRRDAGELERSEEIPHDGMELRIASIPCLASTKYRSYCETSCVKRHTREPAIKTDLKKVTDVRR